MATYRLYSVINSKGAWNLAKKGASDAKIIGKGLSKSKKATLAVTGIGAGIGSAYLIGRSIKDKKLKKKGTNQKEFATAVMVGDQVLNAANHSGNALSNRNQAYYDSLFGGSNATKSTQQLVSEGAKSRAGSFTANRTVGGAETYKGVNKVASGKQAFNMGQKSVGVMGGMRNTWGRMGTMGKAGTIAAGAAVTGLALKGLLGNRKKRERG